MCLTPAILIAQCGAQRGSFAVAVLMLIALTGRQIKEDKYFIVCSCCLYGADMECIFELELTTTVLQRGVLPVFFTVMRHNGSRY